MIDIKIKRNGFAPSVCETGSEIDLYFILELSIWSEARLSKKRLIVDEIFNRLLNYLVLYNTSIIIFFYVEYQESF